MPAALMRFVFPNSLPGTPELLGLRSRIGPASVGAELCMPIESKREGGFDGAFSQPRLLGGAWFKRVVEHFFHEGSELRTGGPSWGQYWMTGPAYPDDWRVSIWAAVLRVPVDDVTDDGLEDIRNSVTEWVYDWYLRLRDWLEVIVELDLDHEHKLPHSGSGSAVESLPWVATTKIKGQDGYQLGKVLNLGSSSMPVQHITGDIWAHSVREANAGRLPPYPHLLLRDARSALHRRMWRRAVVDAATATEAAISPVLDEALDRVIGAEARDALLAGRQFERSLRVARSLGIDIPTDAKGQLLDVRNRVVHGGTPPTQEEAQAAFNVARRLVRAHSPLASDRYDLTPARMPMPPPPPTKPTRT